MRKQLGLVSLIAVAACTGEGPETVGGTAVTAPAGAASTTATTPASEHSFVKPTETKTYQSQGTVQSFSYDYVQAATYTKDVVRDAAGNPVLDDRGFPKREVNRDSRVLGADGQAKQLYTTNAGTVRDPKIQVSYDPRNAQFTLKLDQNGVANNLVFQDPAHRTDFAGARTPQRGTPDIAAQGIRYLEVDNSSDTTADVTTFFYQQPGTSTKYVTYAGYLRHRFETPTETTTAETATSLTTQIKRPRVLDRAAFVFGEQTANTAVPKTGTASYAGGMIASIVNNPKFEDGAKSYFQWMSGTANVGVDFAAGTLTTTLAATTYAPFTENGAIDPAQALPAGASFSAAGTGRIDLVGTGGFTGKFDSASFAANGAVQKLDIAGSTLDGAFYGPAADEIGATFRIVGGVPDQRVDISGAFTGVKK